MASWNKNYITVPKWDGSGSNTNSNVLNVSSLNANTLNANNISTGYIHAANLSTNNGSIAFLSNLVLNTGVIGLGIGPTFLTADKGILYVNGDAVAFPSSFSTIADWSQFKAVADVDMSRSTLYNVQSISTNTISSGTLQTNVARVRSLSTVNVSSGNITFDTLNGRAAVINTLSGSNLVYSNGTFSNTITSNIFSRTINSCNIVNSNSVRSFAISSFIVSTGYIVADVGFFNSTFNSTIISYKGIFQSTATSLLVANNISSGNISASNISATYISNVEQITLSGNRPNVPWNSATLYAPGDIIFVSPFSYVANYSNLDVYPQSNIQGFAPGNYVVGEAAFVDGVGSYSCLVSGFYALTPNNYTGGQWVGRGPLDSDSPTIFWSVTDIITNPFGGTIIGNSNSLIRVGNVSSIYMNASTLVTRNSIADSLQTNNISSGTANINILNTSNIDTSNITSYNITNSNTLSNAGEANLNTLVTSGQVYTQNILNVQGLMSLQSDVYGQTNDVTLLVPPFTTTPQFLQDILNIREGQFETLNIFGGSTGNTLLPPYRNNSIVNIGTSEICPAIVTIGGVNLLEDTAALTVYGEVNVELGSFNSYYTANFYPLNFEANAINVYGLSYLNGGVTITGFTDCLGTLDVQGITTFTGAVNALGIVTIEGETNIAGLLTAEAGIGIVGAATFQAGDIIIGNSGGGPTNNFNLYNYYNGTDVQNLTVNGTGDFRQNVNIDNNLTVGGIIFGTVISGSESVSTINVSTIRANNISTTYLTAGQAFINSISTGSISTPNISVDVLNFKIATGQELLFKGEGGAATGMVFYRNVDEVQEADTGIITDNIDGFRILSASTITIQAEKEINISSLTSINLNTPNGFTNIQYLNTNQLSTSLIQSGKLDNNITGEYAIGAGNIAMYSQSGTQIQDNATVDIIAQTQLNLTSLTSDVSIQAFGAGNASLSGNLLTLTSGLTNINSDSDINLITPLGYTYANYASTGSLYTSTINFDTAVGKAIQMIPAADEIVGIEMYRNIDGEKVGDGSIAIDNENGFQIASVSTIKISATDDMLIRSIQGSIGVISENSNIILSAPETIIPFNLNVSSISTGYMIAGTVIATNGIVTTNVTTSNLFSDYTSTGSIYANSIIVNSNLTVLNGINTIDTVTVGLRTSSITSYYPSPENNIGIDGNINLQGNILSNTFLLQSSNISTNRISTGSLFSGVISSIQFNASSINANRASINNLTGSNSQVFTTNLFPQSAGAQIGFFGGAGTNSGGFYNNISVRSTNTQVLTPDVVGAFSNNIRVQGNLSTQNVFVSSINNKLYPYTSTLNIPFSSFSITGNQAGTPILLYSNVDFRTQGFHRISQKTILSKNTGGTSADIHANIFYTVGAFPSTPSITDGYSALPTVNENNASTFTTLMTEFYVSTPTTRNILYYDANANNYSARLYMGSLFDSVTPDFGNNSTRIPNIL